MTARWSPFAGTTTLFFVFHSTRRACPITLFPIVPMDGSHAGAAHYVPETKMPDSSAKRRTDEPADPAIDTRDRGNVGAGYPHGTALRAKPHQRNQYRSGQSVGNGR